MPKVKPHHSSGLRCWFLLLRGENGQALVLTALCMVVLIGFIGLAIDGGQLRYQKRRLQAAADAAAVAGALELSACGSTTNCSLMQTSAQNALVENGFTGSSLLTNCAARTGTKLELTISNPPCAVPADPNVGNSTYVEVVLSEPVPTVFAKVLGFNSVPIMARAEAAPTGGGNCIYALDPSGSGAITVAAFASITTTCGIVDESSSSSALVCALGSINGTRITVAGGVYSVICGMKPTPMTGANPPSTPDPFASLPTPGVPACGTSTKSPWKGAAGLVTVNAGTTAVLSPGYAYCGGIRVVAGATVTFEPGTYVLESKGGANGLQIDVGSTVTGTGVTFYNYGPTGGITFAASSNSGNVNLVAPTSGTYAGMLFFQDPQNTAAATIEGSPSFSTVLEGSYYFPTAAVSFAFSGNVNYNILVAYDIKFMLFTAASNTGSSFSSNYSSLANGSPLGGTGAVVIQ